MQPFLNCRSVRPPFIGSGRIVHQAKVLTIHPPLFTVQHDTTYCFIRLRTCHSTHQIILCNYARRVAHHGLLTLHRSAESTNLARSSPRPPFTPTWGTPSHHSPEQVRAHKMRVHCPPGMSPHPAHRSTLFTCLPTVWLNPPIYGSAQSAANSPASPLAYGQLAHPPAANSPTRPAFSSPTLCS